jgi:hypothetical protein
MLEALEQKRAKKTLQTVLSIAANLTLTEALDLLDSLDKNFAKEDLYNRTGGELLVSSLGGNSFNLLVPCSKLGPIWFNGGPPGQEKWIKGFVCQYVADCLLRSIVTLGEYVVGAKARAVIRYGAP